MPDSTKQDIALRLLSASPFEWKDGLFSWSDPALAAAIFHGRLDEAPKSILSLSRRIDSDEGRSARKKAFQALTWDGAYYKVVYPARRFTGERVWIEETGKRISGDQQVATHVCGVLRDISSQKKAEETAAYRYNFDPLTGLWNDARMIEALTWMSAACSRYKRGGVFYALQVSNIDDINKSYGFEAGDRLLKGIANRLLEHVRAPDYTARLSGHGFDGVVFGVAMGDCPDSESLHAMRERLVSELSDTPYASPHGDLYASFAMSAVRIPEDSDSATQALELARIALDHSLSREGVFVAYDLALEDLKTRGSQAPVAGDDILKALSNRMITIAYQPIVDAQTRKPHHYECLLRLRQDDGRIMPAGEFIIAAETLGLVHLLDRRALHIASQTLQDVEHVELALNVSAATIKNEVADADYIKALKALGPLSRRVIIELTETVALDDPAMAARFSTAVRALGCTFAIDDFGAGYTTFRNLMAIEADEIKIDGSFITDLAITPHKQVFVRMMVDLAQTFNVKTVAEFVDNSADAELLTRLGVDYLQGYMFGVPNISPDWPGYSPPDQYAAE